MLAVVRGAIGAEHQAMLDVGEEAWLRYCSRMGYCYHSFRAEYASSNRPPAWEKIPWLLSVLRDFTGNVIWADADTLLADQTADLRQMVPQHSASLLWCERPAKHFNSGVIALRNDAQSSEWLLTAWNTGPIEGGTNGVGLYEQPALNRHAEAFGVTPLDPKWHTIGTIGQKGGVIQGFHGAPDRLKTMCEYQASVIQFKHSSGVSL